MDAPATKRDLAQLEERLFGSLDKRFEGRLLQMQSALQEQMRDMQTELLSAFLPWQESVDIQFEELKSNTRNSVQSISERMAFSSAGCNRSRRKLLLNPPAA